MLTAKLILERFDKDHRLLERREQPSRSFVKNFISLLYCAHAQILSAAPFAMTDITGGARTVDSEVFATITGRSSKSNLMIGSAPGLSGVYCFHGSPNNFYRHQATIEGSKIGIQVGIGNAAVTPTDNFLQTRILHGSAAGLLEYGGCELLSIAFANPNGQFTIRRYFTNNSGGLITVQEVGIHSVGTNLNAYSAWAFLVARDLTGAVAVANTELLRVSYVVQITV